MKFKAKVIETYEFEYEVDENNEIVKNDYRGAHKINTNPLTSEEIIKIDKEDLEAGEISPYDFYGLKYDDVKQTTAVEIEEVKE